MSAENFEHALELVLVNEGGWSNNPKDPGGPTMKGVIQRVYDAYRDRHKLRRQSVRFIKPPEIQAIYKAQYWDAVRGDDLPPGVDYAVFDYAVNSGPVAAAKALQRALGVTPDGHIGLVTLETARRANPAATIVKLVDGRSDFLHRLKTWNIFGRGWSNRLTLVKQQAILLAASDTKGTANA